MKYAGVNVVLCVCAFQRGRIGIPSERPKASDRLPRTVRIWPFFFFFSPSPFIHLLLQPQPASFWLFDVILICLRVSALYNSFRGSCSEAGSFTTHCSVPEVPLSPKLTHRTKSTLTLQWKVKGKGISFRRPFQRLFVPVTSVNIS